ncbi:hypothetical protein HHI36_011360 [Cryptolaemus montrouzieri]|uniref:Uncharacterized protein n=1 Tax=Cryptolaemus montrouzieri TaxID=559131 RepID=A0ABD2MLI9_9CUCU
MDPSSPAMNQLILAIYTFGWKRSLVRYANQFGWIYSLSVTKSMISKHTESKIVKFNSKKPWIQGEVLTHKRTKDDIIFTQASNNPSEVFRKARQQYERSLCSEDRKRLFKYIREASNSTVRIFLLRKSDGDICESNLETANILAETLGSVFTQDSANTQFQPILSPRNQNSIESIDFSPDSVEKYLKGLKPGSSPGPDGLNVNRAQHQEHLL